jgi:hypothetical protein
MNEIKEVTNKSGASIFKTIITIVVLLAVGFSVWYAINRINTSSNDNISAVVAVVNGEEISRADFDELLIAQKAILGEPQNDTEEQALENQVIDILISKALLLQKANESGLSIADEEINSQISKIKTQFLDEQAFETALSEQGFTEESFRNFTKNDLFIQNYINSQIDLKSITISEKEIKAEYDLAVAKQDNLPELEVLSGPIKTQLTQQKQQQLISEFITKLKEESDIKIFLN